jgi:hypothetical protein
LGSSLKLPGTLSGTWNNNIALNSFFFLMQQIWADRCAQLCLV